jgi:hypothetical protein
MVFAGPYEALHKQTKKDWMMTPRHATTASCDILKAQLHSEVVGWVTAMSVVVSPCQAQAGNVVTEHTCAQRQLDGREGVHHLPPTAKTALSTHLAVELGLAHTLQDAGQSQHIRDTALGQIVKWVDTVTLETADKYKFVIRNALPSRCHPAASVREVHDLYTRNQLVSA